MIVHRWMRLGGAALCFFLLQSFATASDFLNLGDGANGFGNSNACDGPCWHWTGGVEATYLDPNFHATGNPDADQALTRVDPGWTASPRIWLGAENDNGWGGRVRYWQLNVDEARFNITDFQPGNVADLNQDLKMYDIDAEATKDWNWDRWNLQLSFGGRYGSLERLVQANILDLTTSPANSQLYEFSNQVNAGGITGSIELTRQLGESPWELFGSFRGSALWGQCNAVFDARMNDGGPPVVDNGSAKFNADLTIWEAQAGVQWSKDVCWCRGTVVVRLAFEFQSWNWTVPGGNPGSGEIFDPGVDLYGLAFGLGFTR